MLTFVRKRLFLKFFGLVALFSLLLSTLALVLYAPYRERTLISEMTAVIGVVATKLDSPLGVQIAAERRGDARALLGLFGAFPYVVCIDYAPGNDLKSVSWPIPCARMRDGQLLTVPAAGVGANASFHVRLSNEHIQGVLFEELGMLAALAAAGNLAVLAAMGLTFFLIINRPLSRLTGSMRRFEQDGVAEPVVWSSRDEIGQVVGRFNAMMETEVARVAELDAEHNRTKAAEAELRTALTSLQDAQNELVEAEKMASLGGLVAGIAHEINTPVGVGVTAASYLKEQTNAIHDAFQAGTLKKTDLQQFVEQARQSADIISSNLSRASDLIRSFKQVAVDQTKDEVRAVALVEYVEEVLLSLQPQIKKTAVDVALDGDRGIRLDLHPGALAQVVSNMVMNALIHAFEPGQQGTVAITIAEEGAKVRLRFRDDGKGMPPEVKAKIFEPFFTTRRGSGGSGLGMHILYNQVTGTLGGSVTCQSAVGEGTTFDILLPHTGAAS